MTKKELFEHIAQKEQMYFDLLWYVRKSPEHYEIPGVRENMIRIENAYPAEIQKLREDETHFWQHGFNSGMLAALRYVMSLDEVGTEFANDNFPELDT